MFEYHPVITTVKEDQDEMKKKGALTKISIFLVLTLIILIFYFLNKEWSMIQMRLGNDNPITWQSRDEDDSSHYIEDDIYVIKIDDQKFNQLGVTITDAYYIPNLEEIHLGLWYDSKEYNDDFAFHTFHLELEDEHNKRYDKNTFSYGRDGFFGQFQRRQIKEISLANTEEIRLYIYPEKMIDGEIIQLEPERKLIFSDSTDLELFQ